MFSVDDPHLYKAAKAETRSAADRAYSERDE